MLRPPAKTADMLLTPARQAPALTLAQVNPGEYFPIPVSPFDFNAHGLIDFNDVVPLFNSLIL